jgi:hypothetical protein
MVAGLNALITVETPPGATARGRKHATRRHIHLRVGAKVGAHGTAFPELVPNPKPLRTRRARGTEPHGRGFTPRGASLRQPPTAWLPTCSSSPRHLPTRAGKRPSAPAPSAPATEPHRRDFRRIAESTTHCVAPEMLVVTMAPATFHARQCARDWYFIAKQPAPVPHMSVRHPLRGSRDVRRLQGTCPHAPVHSRQLPPLRLLGGKRGFNHPLGGSQHARRLQRACHVSCPSVRHPLRGSRRGAGLRPLLELLEL